MALRKGQNTTYFLDYDKFSEGWGELDVALEDGQDIWTNYHSICLTKGNGLNLYMFATTQGNDVVLFAWNHVTNQFKLVNQNLNIFVSGDEDETPACVAIPAQYYY